MEKKEKIYQYRERLEKTLASPDLTNEETLKSLVKNQLSSQSPDCEFEIIEKRAKEVSNFLKILRTASGNDKDHPEWKLKQDNEEFRVMYREGPAGTPFHSLLVEGYVDGPVDVCLCISWESELYKKWMPQSNVPTFKVLSSKCLQKVRYGEQISLVRLKLSWPVSAREALVHYFLFEYFQDGLIIVLLNSISDIESISRNTHGFTKEAIPEAKDVVRVDLVGGFALQKVTPERSYFRTIGNLDIKLDFVPPWVINFLSRQIIGNGFRLYQKTVASVQKGDDDYSKALNDTMYTRIRESPYCKNNPEITLEEEERGSSSSEGFDLSIEHFSELQEDKKDENGHAKEIHRISHESESVSNDMQVEQTRGSGEIEEEDEEEESVESRINFKKDNVVAGRYNVNGQNRNISISPEVEKALGTLDKVILMAREYRSRDPRNVENGVAKDLEKKEITIIPSDETPTNDSFTDIQGYRCIRSNSQSKELGHSKIASENSPVFVLSCSAEQNSIQEPILNQMSKDYKAALSEEINGKNGNLPDGITEKSFLKQKKFRLCCFQGSNPDGLTGKELT